MVQNVGEDDLELEADTLGNVELLLYAEVQVPIREAVQNAVAAVSSIQTQNRLPDILINGCRVGEQIDPVAGSADAIRPGNIAVHSAAGDRPNRDRVFRVSIAKVVDGVAFAKGLAAAVDCAERYGQAAAGSENRRKRPAPEEVSQQSRLSFVERGLIDHEEVSQAAWQYAPIGNF